MWEQDRGWQEEWKPLHITPVKEPQESREIPNMAGEQKETGDKAISEKAQPDSPEPDDEAGKQTEKKHEKNALRRQIYPAVKTAAASYPPPRLNTGEERVMLVQVLLCTLILAFSWAVRTADAPFLPELRTELEAMLTTGVEFSADNTFARFADSVVEELRAGARRLLEKIEEPKALESGMGGVWLTAQTRAAPEGASLEEYTLSLELMYPVSGYLTSRYGFRDNPVNGADDFHAGIDIGAAEGTPVIAAQSGIVMRTGYNKLRGYYIILRHAGGVQTLYQHLSYIFVRGGERVEQGQLIANVGSTGFVTGPHLHLELILDGVRVDPLPTFPRYIVE